MRTGSSRSARCCRSPHPPTTITWRSGLIRRVCLTAPVVMPPYGPRSGVFSRRTGGSTASARSGGSCVREGFDVARCTVARLMKDMGIQGIIRGKPHRTTIPDKKAPCPLDKVNREFRVPAPDMLWVSDFTYVATWRGFAYVAFVIDAYARRIVGWRVSTSAHAGFVLDALEQAVHERRPTEGDGAHPSLAIAARNTCRSDTPSGSATPASSLLSAVSETATTTHWPRRSTACSRPRSSIAAALGAASKPSNMQPSNGSTGSTTAVCSSRSGTSLRQKQRQTSTQLWKPKTWPRS